MASCVAQHGRGRRPATCRARPLDSPACDVATTNGSPTAHGVDLNDVICAPTRCPATQGNYLVYRDESHLTATFACASRRTYDKAAGARAP